LADTWSPGATSVEVGEDRAVLADLKAHQPQAHWTIMSGKISQMKLSIPKQHETSAASRTYRR